MPEGAILIARESVMLDFAGARVFLNQGRTTVREGHPILRGRERLFEPLVPTFEVDEAPKAPAAKTQQNARPKSGQQTT